MIVSGGRVFATFKSCRGGGGGVVLDEIDTCMTDIILPILESVESVNPQKDYFVYNRDTLSD